MLYQPWNPYKALRNLLVDPSHGAYLDSQAVWRTSLKRRRLHQSIAGPDRAYGSLKLLLPFFAFQTVSESQVDYRSSLFPAVCWVCLDL